MVVPVPALPRGEDKSSQHRSQPCNAKGQQGTAAALAPHPAARCPLGFSSLMQTHRCPSQWHCSCAGKATPCLDRHQHRQQPGEQLQRETFQQDRQALGMLRSRLCYQSCRRRRDNGGGRHTASWQRTRDQTGTGHWPRWPVSTSHIPRSHPWAATETGWRLPPAMGTEHGERHFRPPFFQTRRPNFA